MQTSPYKSVLWGWVRLKVHCLAIGIRAKVTNLILGGQLLRGTVVA